MEAIYEAVENLKEACMAEKETAKAFLLGSIETCTVGITESLECDNIEEAKWGFNQLGKYIAEFEKLCDMDINKN